MAKDYFQSKEFKDLLKSYEEQRDKGESIYLDADDFADLADYYLSIDQPKMAMDTLRFSIRTISKAASVRSTPRSLQITAAR